MKRFIVLALGLACCTPSPLTLQASLLETVKAIWGNEQEPLTETEQQVAFMALRKSLYSHFNLAAYEVLPPELEEQLGFNLLREDHASFYPLTLSIWESLGQHNTNTVEVIDYLPNSNVTLVQSSPTNLQLYEGATLTDEISVASDCHIHSGCYSPLEPLVFFNTSEGTLITYDIQQHTIVNSFMAHKAGTRRIACHPTEPLIVTGDYEGNLAWWHYDGTLIKTVAKTNRRISHKEKINALAFNHDGSLLASASHDGRIRLWDATGEPVASFQALAENSTVSKDSIYDLAWDDTDIVAVGWSGRSKRGFIRCYSIDGEKIRNWTVSHYGPQAVTVQHYTLADGTRKTLYATGSPEGIARIWSNDAICLAVIEVPNRYINSVNLDATLDSLILSTKYDLKTKENDRDYQDMARFYTLPTRYLQGKLLLPQVLFIKRLYNVCYQQPGMTLEDLSYAIDPELEPICIKIMFASFEPLIQEQLATRFKLVLNDAGDADYGFVDILNLLVSFIPTSVFS